MDNNEPKGIEFFNVQTGETRFAKLGPQIQGYINSSDMGINASRGQDFGWKLGADWVKKVREFREDDSKMDTLSAQLRLEDGVSPSTTQILYYIYERQVRQHAQRVKENDSPFAQEYQEAISAKPKASSK